MISPGTEGTPPLSIPLDTVCFIIGKLRSYENADLQRERTEGGDDWDGPGNPLECDDIDALRERENDYRNEPVLQELETFIGDLPDDQQIDLVALMWLGRDGDTPADWATLREEAARAHNTRTTSYLLGSSMAGDLLQEGLALLGHTCEDSDSEAE